MCVEHPTNCNITSTIRNFALFGGRHHRKTLTVFTFLLIIPKKLFFYVPLVSFTRIDLVYDFVFKPA